MNEKQFNEIPENERFNRVLEGEAYYSSVHTPNMSAAKKFNADPYFAVNLALNAANIKKAKAWGLTVKDANDSIPKPFVLLKRKLKEGKTVDEVKPRVVDEVQNPIPSNVLIGNGSKVLCKFATYWYDAGGGGVGNTLFKVQVTDLIPYVREERADPDLHMNEDGFNINNYLNSEGGTATETDTSEGQQEETTATTTNTEIFDD